MKINIQAVGFNADVQLEDFVKGRVNKLLKLDDDVTNVEVFLRAEKPSVVENKEVEIKFNIPGGDIFAQKQSKTFEEAVDLATDALKRQITKRKEKLRGK
ncbi:ribosome-associated translation inhibitor RaiA [Ancylomarina euxinus]|uniref:Ribosome-associated translation inhibitor RaiA n=1 Tax=Ancylomarina euxinus TaxID=2283627 RepID=A0A425Y6M6_9BACT|nr:ribosome-associated translation inhibitor RaiA [Ancylomarina euxinus]MCZ4693967.1 ribosome-associated translation inhibitor RaiA [Ancylomarina euxinus]MUP14612.1 ribosome-associated translation inhibitor RaiA [Ancylomarina euxinus]RRG24159.1 ribosome-associated translation inhibitor RaiA [Ancylomarina euxinus]